MYRDVDDGIRRIEKGKLERVSIQLMVDTLNIIDTKRGNVVKRSAYLRKLIEDNLHRAPNYASLDKKVF